ncbi:MAG TPA: energy-coupling factor transporter ATPase [Syntrophus sp. (in: bacteria)]|jgi:biotin transport system ATP-binding protein/energy-coupling factor transport system ATP-binding protein|nr:energy-coupling factor transporter ATPase [Syntrophus sp. (in: bacteria)]
MITFKDVSYQYGEKTPPVLEGMDLQIPDGQYVALIGPNGCGKTTLIKHLNALLIPSRGEVRINGMNTRETSCHRDIRCHVGMVFQNPDHQIVGMSVEEDVAFGLENLAVPSREIAPLVRNALSRVGMDGFEKRAPFSLSGGEKRLASIAGVLIMNPRYLALDEPTAYLDPAGRRRILLMIRQLHREGMGIIHVTHDIGEVADADRIIVMEGGGIIMDGTPAEICSFLMSRDNPGLEAPAMAALMAKLKESGWDLPINIISLEDAYKEIHYCMSQLAREKGFTKSPEIPSPSG